MASKKKKSGVGTNPRRKSTEEFIRSALGSTEREPGWEYGTVLPVRVREDKSGKKEREWGLGYSDTAKGMLEAFTAPRKAMQGKEFTPEEAMEFAMNVTAPGVATARYAPGMVNMPIVYHGTPHRFEPTPDNPLGEFDASKIGTGEGAQMKGHGIYLAEKKVVGESYRNILSKLKSKYKLIDEFGNDLTFKWGSPESIAGSALNKTSGNYEKAKKDLLDFAGSRSKVFYSNYIAAANAVDFFKEKGIKYVGEKGSLYTADLPDEMVDRMLDWDKPLSEQPEAVRRAWANLMRDVEPDGIFKNLDGSLEGQVSGEMMYDHLAEMSRNATGTAKGQEQAASLALQEAGIPGIKYADAGSRGKGGKGSRNFVLFPGDEKKAKIINRD